MTSLGLQVGLLLSGAFLVEIDLFLARHRPLLGRRDPERRLQRDHGDHADVAFIFVVMNLVVDVLYLFLDPRISYA